MAGAGSGPLATAAAANSSWARSDVPMRTVESASVVSAIPLPHLRLNFLPFAIASSILMRSSFRLSGYSILS